MNNLYFFNVLDRNCNELLYKINADEFKDVLEEFASNTSCEVDLYGRTVLYDNHIEGFNNILSKKKYSYDRNKQLFLHFILDARKKKVSLVIHGE